MSVGRRELIIIFLSNGLESSGLTSVVQQQNNEKENNHAEITCLLDSFKIARTNGIGTSFLYPGLATFTFLKK